MARLVHFAFASLSLGLLLGPAAFAQSDSTGAVSLKDGRFIINKAITQKDKGVVVHFKAGDVFVPEHLIRDCFSTAKDFSYKPKNEKESKRLARGLIPFNGKWIKKDAAAREMARLQKKLQARIETQKERKLWRNKITVQTKTFTYLHNVPDEIFENLKTLLEVYYKQFTRYWGKKTQLPNKPKIHIYADYEDFLQISGASRGVLGWYHLLSNELHMFWDRTDPEFTIDVLFHEANHMIVDMINGKFRYPHWVEEPMAEYYGASEWDAKRKKMKHGRIQAGRLMQIRGDIENGTWWKLKDLIHKQSFRSYNWGWSFVHYMMSTPKYAKKWRKFWLDIAHKKTGMRRKFDGYFKTMEGKDLEKLLLKYMGHKKLETLEKEWHSYLKKLDVQELEGYERAGRQLRTMGYKQRDDAKKYLSKAVDMGAKNPFTYAALADCLDKGSEQRRALAMISKAIDLDPLEPEFYYQKGMILKRSGPAKNLKAAKKSFLLAAEIEPDRWKYVTAAVEMED